MAKKKKTISVKTKKPDGLQVVRSNEKLTVSWKRKDSNYGAGQQLQYRLNGGSWVSIGINSTITAKVYSIPVGNYNPTNKKEAYKLTSVQFRVRGKRTKYTKGSGKKRKTYVPKWSDWAQVTYSLQTPNAPKAGASLNETYDNISTFSFSPSKGNNANQMVRWCEWQSVLVKDCGYKDGAKAPWASGKLGWQTGTTNAWTNSGSKTITENTATLASGSHTRWFRVRTRGIAGDSAWAYTKHVYAKPLGINNLRATASKTSSGYTVTSKWTTRWSETNPVDFIVAQYAIGIPTENMAAPSGASWTDAGTIKDAAGDEGLTFAVDDALNEDECLFVRAYSQHDHDSNRTPSNVAIAAYGYLKDPEDLTVQTDDTTFRATVTAENTSQVAGSFLAITYRPTTVEDSFIVGIIPSGSTSVTVQCPDWSQETAVAFGVQAIKGSYTAKQRADGAYTYEITKKMESEATLWDGGAVPLAPANVTANPTDIESTIRVAWDWSWTSANKAILSWSDHEDAWESTDEPSEYTVSNIHAASWNIAGLETGKTWYIRVRLSKETGDKETMGPWSDIIPVDLSSAPSIPSLVLSQGSIPADGSVTASWGYTSRDGMGQAYAEICEATITGQGITYGEVIARTQTAQHVTINAADVGWESGETYNLCVRVVSSAGRESDSWSAPVAITIADPITAVIEDTSLVEQAVIYDEQTLTPGAIVSFETDSEKTFTELTATIVPNQSGTGTPSPDNVRPISGWDSVNVTRSGKNLLKPFETQTLNGITLTNNDGVITLNGTATATATFAVEFSNPIPAGDYYWSLNNKDNNANVTMFLITVKGTGNPSLIASNVNSGKSVTITDGENNDLWINKARLRVMSGTTLSNFVLSPQLEHGTTATSYEPYQADTYTTDLPETVYGGSFDVVNGVLTVDRAMVDLGTLNWTLVSLNRWKAILPSGAKYPTAITEATTAISSTLEAVSMTTMNSSTSVIGIAFYNTYDGIFARNGSTTEPPTGQLCYELATPQTYQLTPQTINTLAGVNNVWVDSGSITEAKIADFSYDALCLTEMPLTVTITGAGDGGTTTLALERSAPYHLERPDGTDLNGHEGETIALVSQPGEEEFTITQNDLLGYLDDGAHYRIVATVQDSFGQSNEARLDFEVHWEHQAIMPEATAEIDTDYNIAKITAIPPNGTLEGDTFDIYRLSVDRPELIVQNGTWGTVYVDPYPAIGEFGGHRVVFKTVNGDFITADNQPAWLDLQEDEGDLLDLDYSIIDFDGESIPIEYNVDIKTDFDKDFRETKYLGGSVVGDWNPAVSRTGSIDAVAVVQDDPETIQALRRLAVYPGIAHVRSKDGSSYAANVNVSDQISYNVAGKQLDVSLNITRVDPEGFEGLTYAQWYTEESE